MNKRPKGTDHEALRKESERDRIGQRGFRSEQNSSWGSRERSRNSACRGRQGHRPRAWDGFGGLDDIGHTKRRIQIRDRRTSWGSTITW